MIEDRLADWFARKELPVLALEVRRRRGKQRLSGIVAGAALGASLSLYCGLSSSRTNSCAFLAFLLLGAAYIVIPVMSVRRLISERESGAFSMLAMTRLRSSEIFDQRLVSIVLPMLCMCLAVVPALVLASAREAVSAMKVAGALLLVMAVSVSQGCFGLAISCVFGKLPSALCQAYVAAVFAIPSLIVPCGSFRVLKRMFSRALPTEELLFVTALGGLAVCAAAVAGVRRAGPVWNRRLASAKAAAILLMLWATLTAALSLIPLTWQAAAAVIRSVDHVMGFGFGPGIAMSTLVGSAIKGQRPAGADAAVIVSVTMAFHIAGAFLCRIVAIRSLDGLRRPQQ